MKQLTQNFRTGQTMLRNVPPPALQPGGILIRSQVSLISAGTERMLAQLARTSLLGKARRRPDLTAQVLAKLRREGIRKTWRTVCDRLDREMPLGYSLAGEVVGAAADTDFEPGQRVVAAGAGCANHAEINFIPKLLAARIPPRVDSEAATYTTVGAIALHAVRNAKAQLGETVVVLGLGLIGQLAVQILAAAGCRVVGVDPNPARVALAREAGTELGMQTSDDRLESRVRQFTRNRGADAVLITAATRDNGPLRQAARLARDRARVVVVGVTGMEIPRKTFYEKELSLVVSRSYGPGRYDEAYESKGQDYPLGYVRWTENRNLEAFLDLVAAGKIDPCKCTTHRFPIDQGVEAMELILAGREPHLGVLLTYPEHPASATAGTSSHDRVPTPAFEAPTSRTPAVSSGSRPAARRTIGISLVGAGAFARGTLLPILTRDKRVRLRGVVTASGLSADTTRRKFGFAYASTDVDDALSDDRTQALFIATPHRDHAPLACRALAAGKWVFVEKPLACDLLQLLAVHDALRRHGPHLTVGFNRRFSAMANELKRQFADLGPLTMTYRCSAGRLPPGHWLQDSEQGGRIIGEACHFFDLLQYLVDAPPLLVTALARAQADDEAAFLIRYADGSLGNIVYSSSDSTIEKERLEVFAEQRSAVLEDFRRLRIFDHRRQRRWRGARSDPKGHAQELAAFVDAVIDRAPVPIPIDSLLQTTALSIAAVESLCGGQPIEITPLAALAAAMQTTAQAAADRPHRSLAGSAPSDATTFQQRACGLHGAAAPHRPLTVASDSLGAALSNVTQSTPRAPFDQPGVTP